MARIARALFLAFLCAAPLAAQRKNDPTECPYCHGDPELMQGAGLVSHGGFEFGMTDTRDVDGLLATSDIRWIESLHFEIGFALGSYKVTQKEKKKILAELAELKKVLPDVPDKTKFLDPWLRSHLYAMRAEKAWVRFLEIMQVEESDFPTPDKPWILGERYMGEGPYVGQKGKYEVLIVPTESVHVYFLTKQFGLQIKKTQRWNVVDRDSITVTIHTQDGDLRVDTSLHGHMVFNLAHNMLDGYKHYSYDTPVWIHEGLAHVMEREVDPKFNSFDSSEGAIAEMTRKSDWNKPTRALVNSGKAPRLAELMALKSYAEFELPHHYATWSMVRYLIDVHPEGFACLNAELHGRKGDDGLPDGANIPDAHRTAFSECIGMSYAAFDAAWREWAKVQ